MLELPSLSYVFSLRYLAPCPPGRLCRCQCGIEPRSCQYSALRLRILRSMMMMVTLTWCSPGCWCRWLCRAARSGRTGRPAPGRSRPPPLSLSATPQSSAWPSRFPKMKNIGFYPKLRHKHSLVQLNGISSRISWVDALLEGMLKCIENFHDQMSNIFSSRRIMIHAEGRSDDL